MTEKKEVVKEPKIDVKYLEDKIEFYIEQRDKAGIIIDNHIDAHRRLSGAIETIMGMLKEEFGIDYKLPELKPNDTTKSV